MILVSVSISYVVDCICYCTICYFVGKAKEDLR